MIRELVEDSKGKEIKPLISGSDLIKIGLKPGKIFKEILSCCYDHQIKNDIKNTEDMQGFVNGIIEENVKLIK